MPNTFLCKHSAASYKYNHCGPWADRWNIWLLIKLMPKGVQQSFLFFSFLTIVATFAGITEQTGPPELQLCGQHL